MEFSPLAQVLKIMDMSKSYHFLVASPLGMTKYSQAKISMSININTLSSKCGGAIFIGSDPCPSHMDKDQAFFGPIFDYKCMKQIDCFTIQNSLP